MLQEIIFEKNSPKIITLVSILLPNLSEAMKVEADVMSVHLVLLLMDSSALICGNQEALLSSGPSLLMAAHYPFLLRLSAVSTHQHVMNILVRPGSAAGA